MTELKVKDAVFFNCSNPATGFIKRMAKDKSWADVRWNASLDFSYVSRVDTKNLIHLLDVLNLFIDINKNK